MTSKKGQREASGLTSKQVKANAHLPRGAVADLNSRQSLLWAARSHALGVLRMAACSPKLAPNDARLRVGS